MLKFIVDTQLPPLLAKFLKSKGFDAIHTTYFINGHLLQDNQIIELSISNNLIIITKDSDFLDNFLLKGEPTKILLLKLGNPLLFNPFVTLLTTKFLKNTMPELTNLKTAEIALKTDIKRWKIVDESLQRKLYEWASQIHFLYNLGLSCFLIFLIQLLCTDFFTHSIYLLAIIFLFAGIVHHIRYKKFEINILIDETQSQS